MNYYNQKQIIAKTDKNARILGEVEKWHAHKKGVLHRAFSVALIYKGKYILQHRKHIAFDGLYDLTSSSHQLMEDGKLQDTVESIYQTLEREWDIQKKDCISKPRYDGVFYYKAHDPKSNITEHEICDIYTLKVKRLPTPNFEYAYGYSLVTEDELHDKKSRICTLLTPWAKKMIEKNLI